MDSYDYESASPSLWDHVQQWFGHGIGVLFLLVHVWFIIDAIRRQEWLWVGFLVIMPGFADLWYFFYVYRGSATRGFELPGAFDRKRIKELEAQIHHIGNAHHYAQLGDLHFQRGKLDQAEACYRSALERDSNDLDTRAHLGQCLLRLKRPAEAKPLLEGVLRENPKHEYNYTAMAYAEANIALGETEQARKTLEYVVANNSYPRAKVQLAELYLSCSEPELAQTQLLDVVSEDSHAPVFQRRRDRVWISRARRLMRQISK